ncbi:hypothetical protein [Cyclobacterium xiamenense]|uniref:hypothetical protein n=1 Tax=Cyclobacterium xiamenense TaxID=1297121 RepID=UPI0012BA2125|nr:hypothetical protein [Cyclobacterium xiamenense]
MEPLIEPSVELDQALLEGAKTRTREENQVIVHCYLSVPYPPVGVRIWPVTSLVPQGGGVEAKLLHVEGITKSPEWTYVRGEHHLFTLIFEGLPKDCLVFDLVEKISSPNRFHYEGIARNQSDVYKLFITQ